MQMLTKFPLIICAGALLLGCGSKTPEEHVTQAQQYMDKGELQSAVIELKSALQENSNHAQARWLLGNAYIKMGDGASAEKEFRSAESLGVASAAVQPMLARALLMQDNNDAVLALVPNAQLSSRAVAELGAARGTALLNLGRLAEAEDEFSKALSADPKVPDAVVGKARLALARGQADQAREELSRAFALDKTYAPAWSLLAKIELSQGRSEEAEKALNAAIENQYFNAEDLASRIYIRIATKRFEEANADIKQLKAKLKSSPLVDYVEGLASFQQKQYKEAKASFERVLAVKDDDMPALFYAGASHFMEGNLNQANDYLARFASQNPQYIPALKMLAWIKLQNGEFKDAERYVRPVLKQQPNDVFAMNLLAGALMSQKRTSEGLDYFRQVVALKPELAAARTNLGLGLIMGGNTAAGVAELQKAKELQPSSDDAEVKIVLALLNAKSYDKALEAARAYAAKNPKQPSAQLLLGSVYMALNDFANAAKSFQTTLQIEPGNVSANGGLAAIALRSNQPDKAKQYYEDALRKHPDDVSTLTNLAKVARAQGKYDEMVKRLEKAIASNAEALEPRLMLAQYHIQSGKPEKARELMVEARSANEGHPALLAMSAEAALAARDPAGALKELDRLVKAQPDNAEVHFMIARAQGGLGNKNAYRTELDKTLQLNKNHVQARFALAELLLAENKPKEAATHIDVLKKQTNDSPKVGLLEGQLAELSGDGKKAIAIYEKVFAREKSNFNLIKLEDAQWTAGNRDTAIKLLENWLAQYPKDELTLLQAGNRYMALNRPKDALAAYTRVLKENPDNVVALNNSAWLLLDSDRKRALQYAERANKIAPDSDIVMDTLAVVVSKSDNDKAQALIEKALDKNPRNPTFLYHKAIILRDAGRRTEALRIAQSVLASDKPFPERDRAKQLLQELQ